MHAHMNSDIYFCTFTTVVHINVIPFTCLSLYINGDFIGICRLL